MKEVLKVLENFNGKILFSDAFKTSSRGELIITFLAILELIKNRKITVNQKHNFSEIYILMKEEKVDEQ